MVSLERKFNMSTGAQYMDETNSSGNSGGGGGGGGIPAVVIGGGAMGGDSNEQLLDPVLTSNDGSFKPLKTVPAFSIHLLISTIISLVGIILAAAWTGDKRCDAYFIMMYLRAIFWVITFLFDHIVKKQHDQLRLNGYHEFHRATAMQKGISLYVVSLWNSMLLAVMALTHHYYGDDFWLHCMEGWLSPVTYVAAFNATETIVLMATHACYIDKVRKFNKSAQPPDALRGANSSPGSLGLMQPNRNTSELLEKQADLIAYLRDHNMKLNQKLHQMQLNARPISIAH